MGFSDRLTYLAHERVRSRSVGQTKKDRWSLFVPPESGKWKKSQ